jgi:hypothetical protein
MRPFVQGLVIGYGIICAPFLLWLVWRSATGRGQLWPVLLMGVVLVVLSLAALLWPEEQETP